MPLLRSGRETVPKTSSRLGFERDISAIETITEMEDNFQDSSTVMGHLNEDKEIRLPKFEDLIDIRTEIFAYKTELETAIDKLEKQNRKELIAVINNYEAEFKEIRKFYRDIINDKMELFNLKQSKIIDEVNKTCTALREEIKVLQNDNYFLKDEVMRLESSMFTNNDLDDFRCKCKDEPVGSVRKKVKKTRKPEVKKTKKAMKDCKCGTSGDSSSDPEKEEWKRILAHDITGGHKEKSKKSSSESVVSIATQTDSRHREDKTTSEYKLLSKLLEKIGDNGSQKNLQVKEFKINDSATAWLIDFERKATFANLKEELWKKAVGRYMSTALSPTYQKLYNKYKDIDWDKFRPKFIKQFETGQRAALARIQLSKLEPKNFKDVEEYFIKCHELVAIIGPSDGASIGLAITNKFPSHVQRRVENLRLNSDPYQVLSNIREAVIMESHITHIEDTLSKDKTAEKSVSKEKETQSGQNRNKDRYFRRRVSDGRSGSDSGSRSGSDNGDIQCHNCHGIGHIARVCPSTRQIYCYVCNKFGHMSNNCGSNLQFQDTGQDFGAPVYDMKQPMLYYGYPNNQNPNVIPQTRGGQLIRSSNKHGIKVNSSAIDVKDSPVGDVRNGSSTQ